MISRSTELEGSLRSLCILATTPHDDVCGARFGPQILLVHLVARSDFLEQARSARHHAGHVLASIRGHNAQKTLASFLGQVGLLEHTLGGVEVRKVERGARMARVEDSRQSHPGLERAHHNAMHLIINDVARCSEIHRVNDLVVAVVFVTV